MAFGALSEAMRRLAQSLVALVLAGATTLAFAQQDSPSEGSAQSATQSAIGYPTVAAALDALRARGDIKISVQDGWTIVNEPKTNTFWSFTPAGHPAHPAAIKRTIVEKDGAFFIAMSGLCQAQKAACDKLMAEFRELNDRIRESMQRRAKSAPADRQLKRSE
jgi:hypothetical protein